MFFNIPAISSGIGALAFVALTVLLLLGFRGSRISLCLIAASVLSALWFALHVHYYQQTVTIFTVTVLQLGELARDAGWFLFLSALLLRSQQNAGLGRSYALPGAVCAGLVALAGYFWTIRYGPLAIADYDAHGAIALIGFLAMTVAGLVLTEQLYRNTALERRWAIRYLCIGIGAMFAYDFVMYADALLFTRINPDFWAARGAVNACAVPLIAVSAARNRDWNTNLFVSRRVVFHSGAIMAAGAYLLLMAAAGYYLQAYGGSWGGALRIVFTFAAMVALVVILFSSQVRLAAKRFIATHFYRNKYEYGEEWLRFTRSLSSSDDRPEQLKANIVAAIGAIMQSPAGVLWERMPDGQFRQTAGWNMAHATSAAVPAEHPAIQRIEREESVIDLRSYALNRSIAERTLLPGLFTDQPHAWLLIPICHGEDLVGLVVLQQAAHPAPLTQEDIDLLRTVGRQAASYLVLLSTTERLTEARQFETFNKLSAFLIHDLKNVIAQLGLIQQNAVKHRHNPAFVDDAFNTIDAAVTRMNHMLAGLRQGQRGAGRHGVVDVPGVVREAVGRRTVQAPRPALVVGDAPCRVLGDAQRLASVVEHLVQNAQDATPADGTVEVSVAAERGQAVIRIRDTGVGMDQEFIEKRLFRPFDSTKGNAGMGIGVYESRHVVQEHGGRLEVESRPRQGTIFTISLPLYEEQSSVVRA